MCGEANISARWCGNRSSFKTTGRSRRTRVPVGFPAYGWSAHPYGRALLRRTCAFWLVLGRRPGGETPWEPRKSTVGAEETLSEFAGTWPEYPDASTRSAEPEQKGDDTGERGDDKAEGQPLAPRGRVGAGLSETVSDHHQ